MRTTVDLDDAVLRAARAIARDEGVSLGTVLSRLARRGLTASGVRTRTDGFPVFDVGANGTPVDLDAVNSARDDG